MRVLMVSLECEGNVVSGNGTYAAAIRRAVIASGSQVHVICGRPRDGEEPAAGQDNDILWTPVSKWGRLNRESAWEEFATVSAAMHAGEVAALAPEVAISVDWTGTHALAALMAKMPDHVCRRLAVVHMNFRTYWLSDGLALDGEEALFYRVREAEAMGRADLSVALCRADKLAMESLSSTGDAPSTRASPDVGVLSPPLRRDVALRAKMAGAGDWKEGPERDLILFVGRITQEKNVLSFADACTEAFAELAELGCKPALVGHAAENDAYSQACVARFRHMPDAFVSGFVNAEELAGLFKRTRVMCHPAAYEAWGMTVAEAAAFGVPSLVHSGSGAQVGVCELLPVGECTIGIDFSSDATTVGSAIVDAVRNTSLLQGVSERARKRSLEWDEDAYARALGALLEQAVARHASCLDP